jgi:hypothetical protein
LFICRAFFWFWFVTRGYFWWSKFWRLILEKKGGVKMTDFAGIGQLEQRLAEFKWRRDPLAGSLDVISRPETVERIYQDHKASGAEGQPEVGDCDDFAIYAADRVLASAAIPMEAYLLTINWFDDQGKWHGHNVCALKRGWDDWGHIGNWHRGRARWGFTSLHELALDITGDGVLIAWASATVRLQLDKLWIG